MWKLIAILPIYATGRVLQIKSERYSPIENNDGWFCFFIVILTIIVIIVSGDTQWRLFAIGNALSYIVPGFVRWRRYGIRIIPQI